MAFLLSGLMGNPVKGQVQEEIDVVKPYQPKLSDAIKMDLRPGREEIKFQKPDLTYDNEGHYLPMEPVKEQLPAVSLGKRELDPLKNTFLKAGYGNYSNAFAEFNYNNLRSEDQMLSAYVKHHSGNGPVENSNFGEQIVNLGGKQYFDQKTLSAEAYFKNNIYHYYGYDHSNEGPDLGEDSIRQRYTGYGASVTFDNERSDTNSINYNLKAEWDGLLTRRDARENRLHLKGKLKEHLQQNAAVFGADYQLLDYNMDGEKYQRNIMKINAHYQLNHELGQAEIGFNSATASDSSSSNFHFYPYLNVEIPIMPNKITAFGGLKGDLQANTYRDFVEENPFTQTQVSLQNTNEKLEIYAGVKGHINEKFSYTGRLTYKNTENLPLYVNNPSRPRHFSILYDTATTTIFQLHGEIKYDLNDKLDLFLETNFRRFTMASREQPWHRPTLDYSISADYNIGQKISLSADLFGFNQRKARVFNENREINSKELAPILDINLGINYRFSKAFTAFFNFNNILSQEYEYWNNYPTRGFHLMGGIKLNLY